MAVELGTFGVWSRAPLWIKEGDAAAELEELGYGALWLGGAPGDLDVVSTILGTSGKIAVATGIVNVWSESAGAVSGAFRRVVRDHPGRFLLGIGAGHREFVGDEYAKPYEKLVRYLDDLDVPAEDVVLAALGPRVLKLAAIRTAGAHPYLVTPEHTATAREVLGTGKLLAPEQHVVLETDPAAARALARQALALYLGLPNYTNNWLRLGFTAEDLEHGGSDRLVDALVAWGTPEQVAARLREHVAAGADHVAVQVVASDGGHHREAYRELAEVLF